MGSVGRTPLPLLAALTAGTTVLLVEKRSGGNGPRIRNDKSGIEAPMMQRTGQYLIELEIAVIGSASAAVGPTFSRPEYLLRLTVHL